VFNDSRLLGIISLRRASEPFDKLDMIASVSIAAQAMLIFKRSTRTQTAPVTKTLSDSVIRPKSVSDIAMSTTTAISSSDDKDMEMTDQSITDESSQNMVPKEVINKFRQEQVAAKKTITLMSRENAEKIAVDRYRTAAVGGEPLSVMIVEVDGLSKLREQDGDEVAYKVFAAIVKYIFTKIDKKKEILGRYGQNGLSILMPQVDMNAAERFAEMTRQSVSKARYKTAYGEKSATLSIGVAALTDDTGDYASMVKRADMALFVAKKNGRNCVKVRL
jgi:diguanylate cyclase (GGDEF)-like protein